MYFSSPDTVQMFIFNHELLSEIHIKNSVLHLRHLAISIFSNQHVIFCFASYNIFLELNQQLVKGLGAEPWY